MPHLTIRFELLATGAMAGLGYAILGAGLVLVYRTTKIINLAHGQIGAVAAVVLIELGTSNRLPYFVALPIAVAVGAVIGWLVERLLVRPLADRSRLAVLVGTIGVTQVLLLVQLKLPAVTAGQTFPVPFDINWQLDNLTIRGEHVALLIFGPLFLTATAGVLRWTRLGLGIRAMAENKEAASLAGIRTDRMSSMVWVLAGGLAAIAAILTMPLTGSVTAATSTPTLGPSLLLRALAAGVAGGLTNLPLTVLAGVVIGVVESTLYASYPATPGVVDAILFVAILVLLLVRVSRSSEPNESVVFGTDPVPLRQKVRDHPRVRQLRWGGGIGALVIVVLIPFVYSKPSQLFQLSRVPIYAMIGISIVMLTGWAGQLSLGQMGFVGVGAMGTAALAGRGVSFGPAVGYMTIVGVLLAVVIGIPALRLRGLLLAIVTLGFAVAAYTYVLPSHMFHSNATEVETIVPGKLGPFDFGNYRTLYYTCVVALVGVVFVARRMRSTGVGRRVLSVEGNEDAAAAMAVPPARVKLTAFALSGAIATFAGGLLAGVTQNFSVGVFSPDQSLQVLAMAVVGGIGSVAGAVLGAIYVIGIPSIFGNTVAVQLAVSGIGLLLVLRFFPAGLMGGAELARDRLVAWIAPEVATERPRFTADDRTPATVTADDATADDDASAGVKVDALRALQTRHGHHAAATPTDAARAEADGKTDRGADGEGPDRPAVQPPALDVRGISVTLRGRQIVRHVDLHLQHDEIVGLIGANGAGKTTLMNALGGFLPATGTVQLDDVELTSLQPAARAAAGLGRSFQGAMLYPRLTVRECIQVALEVRRTSEVIPSLLALAPSVRTEAWNRRRADELIDLLGLGRYAEQPSGALSTGTRRIVEFGCLIAQRPKVVLLDEPTAGVAQRETEAFVPLLLEVRKALGASILIIEHDLPLVMAICDRLYCLESGAVIASGAPTDVRNDPRVVASYLGTDERAISRSGALPSATEAATNGTRRHTPKAGAADTTRQEVAP
ncbi:MAG TPA: ATP-binding cassette domain-containing protein [Acidimicrobiales bacterium]|jgi:ABC-type branched-subunit amino acid transport system ATPase component/ABC-type branched-subunit amino acid transport system permease subunit|nr:ATP-binding cassette domain-containing protein [Acidimicrobiales bacterium]